MAEFLDLLKAFKDENRELVIVLNCEKKRVIIKNIRGDAVTFDNLENDDRYDMHYTRVVICSSR